MPVKFLNDAEYEKLNRFPELIPDEDISAYFTLSNDDLNRINIQRGTQNRLGFAIQLCAVRYMGISPKDLKTISNEALLYLTTQLNIDKESLSSYGKIKATKFIHLNQILEYLKFRKANKNDLNKLSKWLLNRALEHNSPKLLITMSVDYLLKNKIYRPGVTVLERLIAKALNEAIKIHYDSLKGILTIENKAFLNQLLVVDEETNTTQINWLRKRETTNSSKAILEMIKRLNFLKDKGVQNWDLSTINPNYKKKLCRLGQRSTNQYIQRLKYQKRYPLLIIFLSQILTEVIDETIDMFNQALWDCFQDGKKELQEYQVSVAVERNEKLLIFQKINKILLDPEIDDTKVRSKTFTEISKSELQKISKDLDNIIKKEGDNPISFFVKRYSYIRQFSTIFLKSFKFKSKDQNSSLLKAIDLIINLEKTKKIPINSPVDFISKHWKKFVLTKNGDIETINKNYYELAVLWTLRTEILDTNIWVEGSRKHAPLESYFMPLDKWALMKSEVCSMMGVPENGQIRLDERKKELTTLIQEINEILNDSNNSSKIRNEKNKIIVSPLKAIESSKSLIHLRKLIGKMLPKVELTDILIEVDKWIGFSDCFKHESLKNEVKTEESQSNIFASILAQSCNFGLHQMEDISGISYRKLSWCSTWYIRDETLKAADTKIINYQHKLPLAKKWGDGSLSSSDGQRFPVSVKTRVARPLPKYFGYGSGLTYYTWTSDQLSQYGIKVLPATTRDAPFVLDEIFGNETELEVLEHTVDTAGQTEKVFGVFDIASILFSPRLKDIGTQSLYRFKDVSIIVYENINFRFKGIVNEDIILKSWDDLLRMVGSFKTGWVTASLVLQKIQSIQDKNHFAMALHEYGRISKTIHILKWYKSEVRRRRVNKQLNKGEAIHSLRTYIHHANKGNIRHRYYEEQQHQAACLNLVTNIVITWYTRYIKEAADQLILEGYEINENDLEHLWPTRFENINVHGKIRFNFDEDLSEEKIRSFRLNR